MLKKKTKKTQTKQTQKPTAKAFFLSIGHYECAPLSSNARKALEQEELGLDQSAQVGLQRSLPDTLPQTAMNTTAAQAMMLTWLQHIAGPAANCSSSDKPHFAIILAGLGSRRPPLLPKPPKIHLYAISWTSVRDWTPLCSRSSCSLPKLNFFPPAQTTHNMVCGILATQGCVSTLETSRS